MVENKGPEDGFDYRKVAATENHSETGEHIGYIKDVELAQKAAEAELENRDNITESVREEALFRSYMSDDLPYSDQDIAGIEANRKSSEVIEKDIYQRAFQSYIDLGKTKDEAYMFAGEQVRSYRDTVAKRRSYYAE